MEEHLKVASLVFKFLGFWPIHFNSRIAAFLYKIYYYFVISSIFVFVTSLCMEVPNAMEKGLLKFISQFGVVCNLSGGLVKYLILHKPKARELIRKIKVTEQSIINGNDAEVKKIYMEYANYSNKLCFVLSLIYVIAIIIFAMVPFLIETRLHNLGKDYGNIVVDGYKERQFFLDVYLPFNKYKYYAITYPWNLISGSVTSLCTCASDNVYFGFMIFATGQLVLLQREIELAINVSKKNQITQNLKKAILYHKSIIRYTQELSDVMTQLLLFCVLTYVLQIALTSFQLVTQTLTFEAARAISYLLIIFTNLFFYYWLGNEVQLSSLHLMETITNSNWYDCDNQTKKTLLFIMLRAKTSLKFPVGPFFYLSTDTMLKIFKSCITYTAAVRTMYTRN